MYTICTHIYIYIYIYIHTHRHAGARGGGQGGLRAERPLVLLYIVNYICISLTIITYDNYSLQFRYVTTAEFAKALRISNNS